MPDHQAQIQDPDELQHEHDEIALVAYSYWQGRGCADGHDMEDWLMAEQEVLSRRSPARSEYRSEARTAA